MADSSDDKTSGDRLQVENKLKECMREWREFVIILYSVLIWEVNYYPLILGGSVTTLFLVIWYLDTSVLTTISVIGIVSSIVDYSIPALNQNFFDPSKWSSEKESKFERVCTELSKSWQTIVISYNNWQKMKASNPKMYYAILLSTLVVLSWIGNVVHNLLLTYLFVLLIVLFPGLKHHGIVDQYIKVLTERFATKIKKN